jgi:hypothetical protein
MLAAIILQVRPLLTRVSTNKPDAPLPKPVSNPPLKTLDYEAVWQLIDTDYNALVDDLFKNNKLNENLVKPLEEKIKSFQENYSAHECFYSYSVSIGIIENTIKNLRVKGDYLFVDIRQDDIVLVPEDGNCLYRAVATHMELMGHPKVSHEKLRFQAVQWMQRNAGEWQLQALFADTVDYFKQKETAVLENLIAGAEKEPLKQKAYREDLQIVGKIKTIQDYCAYASKPNKFATAMEILALSAIYEMPIRILVFKEKKFQHAYPTINGDTYPNGKLLTLVFEDEAHYNFKFSSKN